MPRTDADKVATICEVDPLIDLEAFVLQANELVTECCADAGYSDQRMELIERNLAAHFMCCQRDMRVSSEAIGGAITLGYQSKIDLGLSLTHYGQMAQMLDTAGGLSSLNARILEPVGDGVVPIISGVHCGLEADLDGDGLEG